MHILYTILVQDNSDLENGTKLERNLIKYVLKVIPCIKFCLKFFLSLFVNSSFINRYQASHIVLYFVTIACLIWHLPKRKASIFGILK